MKSPAFTLERLFSRCSVLDQILCSQELIKYHFRAQKKQTFYEFFESVDTDHFMGPFLFRVEEQVRAHKLFLGRYLQTLIDNSSRAHELLLQEKELRTLEEIDHNIQFPFFPSRVERKISVETKLSGNTLILGVKHIPAFETESSTLERLRIQYDHGQLVLIDRQGRRVRPVIENAGAFKSDPKKFILWLLSRQGLAEDITWQWGSLAHYPELPRVIAGKEVLYPGSCRIAARDKVPQGDWATFSIDGLKKLRRGTRTLPVVVTSIKGEISPAREQITVVPFTHPRLKWTSPGRTIPLSSLLSVSVQIPSARMDDFITKELPRITAKSDGWFYSRELGTATEIRIRIPVKGKAFLDRLQAIERATRKGGFTFELTPYYRLSFHYGGDAGALAFEEISSADSVTAVKILKDLVPLKDPAERWSGEVIAFILSAHAFLESAGIAIEERLELCQQKARRIPPSLHETPLFAQWESFFTDNSDVLHRLIRGVKSGDITLDRWKKIFDQRSDRISPLQRGIRRRIEAGDCTVSELEFTDRLIHMSKLRFSGSFPGMLELFLYKKLGDLYADDLGV